jgi:hypothetical protein
VIVEIKGLDRHHLDREKEQDFQHLERYFEVVEEEGQLGSNKNLGEMEFDQEVVEEGEAVAAAVKDLKTSEEEQGPEHHS